MIQDFNDLYLYAQVVEHGGFAAAGRAIGLPKSKLSRRIALLEERLGVRLLQRSTRKFSVTELGQDYYRHCVAMLVEAEAAQAVIDRSRAEPHGIVKLSCPPALLCFQVGDMIARFMVAHPRVTVLVESTSRKVDVIAEGFRPCGSRSVSAAGRERSHHARTGAEHAAAGRQPEPAGRSRTPHRASRPHNAAEPRL